MCIYPIFQLNFEGSRSKKKWNHRKRQKHKSFPLKVRSELWMQNRYSLNSEIFLPIIIFYLFTIWDFRSFLEYSPIWSLSIIKMGENGRKSIVFPRSGCSILRGEMPELYMHKKKSINFWIQDIYRNAQTLCLDTFTVCFSPAGKECRISIDIACWPAVLYWLSTVLYHLWFNLS